MAPSPLENGWKRQRPHNTLGNYLAFILREKNKIQLKKRRKEERISKILMEKYVEERTVRS